MMCYKNIWPVVLWSTLLMACSGNSPSADKKEKSWKPVEEPVTEMPGKPLFKSQCSTCHGIDATGMGDAPNLRASALDSAGIAHVISNGKITMPAFSDRLTQTEIGQLAGYVYSLR